MSSSIQDQLNLSSENEGSDFYEEIEQQAQNNNANQQDPQEEENKLNSSFEIDPLPQEQEVKGQEVDNQPRHELIEQEQETSMMVITLPLKQRASIENSFNENTSEISPIYNQKLITEDEEIKDLKDVSMSQVTPLPLVEKGVYSLVSDIKLGWKPVEDSKGKPKYLCDVPPVIAFKYPDDIYTIQEDQKMARAQSHSSIKRKSVSTEDSSMNIINLIYQGFRPRDSLEIHENFRKEFYTFDYPQYQNLKPSSNQIMSMLSDNLSHTNQSALIFDSFFEGGNLDKVVKVTEFQYDLYLRPDTNTKGYCNWFYFKVKFNANLLPHINTNNIAKDKLNFRFTIVNMYKKYQLYCAGQKPLVHSTTRQKIFYPQKYDKFDWTKEGISAVKYGLSKLCQVGNSTKSKKLYQLAFNYQFEFTEDEVYFSYSIPFTYSNLQKEISNYKKIQKQLYGSDDAVFDSAPLCKSLSGLTVPLITITDFQDRKLDLKKIIILQGRVHPGESNSSWIVHGIILSLISKDPIAKKLRSKYIFKIIPMINPDGVVFGNFRCCFLGKDMNRMFFNDEEDMKLDERLIPEIVSVKKLVQYCKSIDKNRILGFFDVHQHSKRKSAFMYGPQYPLHHNQYQNVRVLPKIMSNSTEMFRFYSCRFRNEDYKENCARMFIEREYGVTYSYCIECSQQAYMNKRREIVDFTEGNLIELGKVFVQSLNTFSVLLENQAKIQEQKMQVKLQKAQEKQEKLRQQHLQKSQMNFQSKEYLRQQSAGSVRNQEFFSSRKQNQKVTQKSQIKSNLKDNSSVFQSSKNGGMTLNDYIEMMKDPANFDENEFEDQEELIPSSGSDSDDQEFSKYEQEALYRKILASVTKHENTHNQRKSIDIKIEQWIDEEIENDKELHRYNSDIKMFEKQSYSFIDNDLNKDLADFITDKKNEYQQIKIKKLDVDSVFKNTVYGQINRHTKNHILYNKQSFKIPTLKIDNDYSLNQITNIQSSKKQILQRSNMNWKTNVQSKQNSTHNSFDSDSKNNIFSNYDLPPTHDFLMGDFQNIHQSNKSSRFKQQQQFQQQLKRKNQQYSLSSSKSTSFLHTKHLPYTIQGYSNSMHQKQQISQQLQKASDALSFNDEVQQPSLYVDSLKRNDKLKQEYMKLKDIRNKIKNKQNVLFQVDQSKKFRSSQVSPDSTLKNVYGHSREYMGFLQKNKMIEEQTKFKKIVVNKQVQRCVHSSQDHQRTAHQHTNSSLVIQKQKILEKSKEKSSRFSITIQNKKKYN